jgi:2,3-dihydro-2,3-dihydroxybenzoate dehydrogenase
MSGGVAVVSGAGQGIGAAVAEALAGEGMTVAGLDVDSVRVDAVATEQRLRGRRMVPFRVDVADRAAVDDAIKSIEHDLGPIGVLVNVAGILRPATAIDATEEDWAETFAVNTNGVFYLSQAAARLMIPRGSGSIVTVGSNAAGVPRTGMAAYAASKAAATMFTRCLGLELAASGIRCNIVSPGSTVTAMQRALWTADGPQQVIDGSLESYRVGIPLGRLADPADIADAVLFLASDRARHITMQNLYVDGGATLRA